MKNHKNIVIVGGGYAGIHLIAGLKKQLKHRINQDIKIFLIDKNHFHFEKVKLFRGITEEVTENLQIPLTSYCGQGIHFIQGMLDQVNPLKQIITVKTSSTEQIEMTYDQLILTIGSIPREVNPEHGGKTLSSLDRAIEIRKDLTNLIQNSNANLKIAVVGAGITGIETAVEINEWMNKEIKPPRKIEVFLINEKNRLLEDIPEKVSTKLERILLKHGIPIIHQKKVTAFHSNQVHFSEGESQLADYCIWTVGQIPSPVLKRLGLSISKEGRLLTDSHYRLVDHPSIYAIGDCALTKDPETEAIAGMTCKEAISQAQRLAKIIKADLEGKTAKIHQNYPDQLCIGLGSSDGSAWSRQWGIDFIITGKIGSKIREYTWNIASLNKG